MKFEVKIQFIKARVMSRRMFLVPELNWKTAEADWDAAYKIVGYPRMDRIWYAILIQSELNNMLRAGAPCGLLNGVEYEF